MAGSSHNQGGVAIAFDRSRPPKGKGADSTRINERIVSREVRVISPEGDQLGILSTDEARRIADERGMDLVEVSPESRPPVCRIMDYGKYKYTMKKKQQNAKKRSISQDTKEVKLRPKTEEHDYQVKLKHIMRFLMDGDKAKITVRFRGREMAHKDIGMEMLRRIVRDVGELGTVTAEPMMEGRLLQMAIGPSPKALVLKRARDEKRRVEREAAAKKDKASGAHERDDRDEEEPEQDVDDTEEDDEDDDDDNEQPEEIGGGA